MFYKIIIQDLPEIPQIIFIIFFIISILDVGEMLIIINLWIFDMFSFIFGFINIKISGIYTGIFFL